MFLCFCQFSLLVNISREASKVISSKAFLQGWISVQTWRKWAKTCEHLWFPGWNPCCLCTPCQICLHWLAHACLLLQPRHFLYSVFFIGGTNSVGKKDFRANTTPCTWAGPSLMPICTTQILSQKQGWAFTNRFLTATLAQGQVHFEVMALNVFQFCRFQRYSLFDSKQQWQTTLLGLLILLRAHYSLLLPTLGFVCFKNQTDLGCFFF